MSTFACTLLWLRSFYFIILFFAPCLLSIKSERFWFRTTYLVYQNHIKNCGCFIYVSPLAILLKWYGQNTLWTKSPGHYPFQVFLYGAKFYLPWKRLKGDFVFLHKFDQKGDFVRRGFLKNQIWKLLILSVFCSMLLCL